VVFSAITIFESFQQKAEEKGFLSNEEYELGHGHAMALFAYFKGKRD